MPLNPRPCQANPGLVVPFAIAGRSCTNVTTEMVKGQTVNGKSAKALFPLPVYAAAQEVFETL
jgi:hypothetical protein